MPNPVRLDLRGAKYAPPMRLNGTAAIISGAASGLGEAVARALAATGATVVIADLNEELGKTVAAESGGLSWNRCVR